MHWLALFVVIFFGIRLLVALTNLLSRPWLASGSHTARHPKKPSDGGSAITDACIAKTEALNFGLVSVLIPARNEGKNIENILRDLLTHDYRHLEILVYDDLSEDNTADLVKRFEAIDHRIRLIPGKPLPPGWLGKNHACHQLAKEAHGDFLLFMDADIRILPGLISASLSHIRKHGLALLSIFPKQRMHTWSEKAIVPLMNWILVSLLPLILTRLSSWPSFSAANGQFMLFDAQIYHQYCFHEMVKGHQVEDIVIFRKMKRLRLRVQTLLSDGRLVCRMYHSFNEALQGFSKNVFEFFGGSIITGFAFGLVTTLGFIPMWINWGSNGLIIYLVFAGILRALVALSSRQALWQNIFMAPVQQMAFMVVLIVAAYNNITGKTRWKGRILRVG